MDEIIAYEFFTPPDVDGKFRRTLNAGLLETRMNIKDVGSRYEVAHSGPRLWGMNFTVFSTVSFFAFLIRDKHSSAAIYGPCLRR